MNYFNVLDYYNDVLIITLIVYTVANTLLIGWLANQKGYSVLSWMFLGFLFGVFALITLGFAPNKDTEKILLDVRKSLQEKNEVNNTQQKVVISEKRNSEYPGKIKDKNTTIPSELFDNSKFNFKDEFLINKKRYNQLNSKEKIKYCEVVEQKIKTETNINKKKFYYENLYNLGFLYYKRFL